MTKQQGFLATFRIDEGLWGKFKDIAKNKQTNASALIIQYIQGVVSSGGVDNVSQPTPQNIDNLPKLSIQDIEKIIDEKINSSIQAIDNIPNQSIQNIDDINTLSIQDIDNRIDYSLTDGKIGEAIATSYKAAMGQFNGLLEELQDLKSQLQELKSISPVSVPISLISEQLPTNNEQLMEQGTENGESETISPVHPQLTTDDGQFTEDVEIALYSTENPSLTEEQIIALFGLESIVIGTRYTKDSLRDDGILDRFAQNQEILSNLGIKYREGISPVNSILKKLNFTVTQHKDKRTYHVGEE